MKYESTINKILKKLTNELPIVKEGDLLETYKTVYPDYTLPRKEKNVIIEGLEMTKPLALSKGGKDMMRKDGSSILGIYKDLNRGDILRVTGIDGNKVFVENISLKEEYKTSFSIDKTDILREDFRMIQRRSSDLVLSLQTLGIKE